ncbi:MAG: NUDIX hydrolase [bacterium]|nr:NUDIX hydrolase [bacterium]
MAIVKWQKIKTRRVWDGWKKMDVITFKLPDGKLKDFDIVSVKGEVVSVVGITKDKQVVLIRLFRPGPEKVFYEFPLGLIEKGESPATAAKREFLEETGFTGKLKKTGIFYLSAYDTIKIHCFLATDCWQKTKKLHLDPAEFIEVKLVSLAQLKQMLKKCQVRNFGEGYLALDFYFGKNYNTGKNYKQKEK